MCTCFCHDQKAIVALQVQLVLHLATVFKSATVFEASQLNLKIGQRGRAEIVVETFGKPCHSANPEKGINAVYKMEKVIEAIRGLVPTEHPVLGKGILELTDIKSAPYPGASVVPEYCRATYDRRLLVGETNSISPMRRLFSPGGSQFALTILLPGLSHLEGHAILQG